jgi:hypothetical protein
MSTSLHFILKRKLGIVLNLLCGFDHLIANNESQVTQLTPNIVQNPNPYLLYATYSESGRLRSSELLYLKSFQDRGWNILIISNSKLEVEDFVVAIRKNRGRDLGGYRDGLSMLNNLGIRPVTLLLSNSSIIVNPEKIESFMNGIESRIKDMSGSNALSVMTVSHQFSPHIQTYFLLFHNFDKYSDSVTHIFQHLMRNWKFKRTAIFFGEKRLLDYLNNVPLTIDVLHNSYVLSANKSFLKIEEINPSIYFWKEILNSEYSFLKRNIVSKKNHKSIDIEQVKKIIEKWEKIS